MTVGARQFTPQGSTIIIIVFALFLMAPALVLGTPPNQGIHYDVTWSLDFIEQLRAGTLYPRWLPGSFGGLGAPVFYYYAPLPFFAIGLADLAIFGLLPAEWTIAVAMTAFRMLAGFGMRMWLMTLASPRAATIGAVLYMAAPYHLLDFYLRGSLGEVAMFAVIPYLALATAHLGKPGTRPVAFFAVACALALLSHLVVGSGVGLLMVGAHLLFVALRPGHSRAEVLHILLRGAVGGLLGLALAATYVVPAIVLLPHVAIDQMFTADYAATNWLLAFPERWFSLELLAFVASVSAVATVLALGVVLLARTPDARKARFWAWMSIGLIALLCGVPEWPWQSWSPLSRLQFPWRMLVVVEFAIITCIVGSWHFLGSSARFRLAGTSLAAAVPAFFVLIGTMVLSFQWGTSEEWRGRQLVIREIRLGLLEYFPPGHRLRLDRPEPVSVDEVRDMLRVYSGRAEAWSDAAHVSLSDLDRPSGSLTLRVHAPADVLVLFRRFYFPFWRLELADGSPGPILTPHGEDLLMSFRAPAGTSEFRLVPYTPWIMVAANVLSLAALACFLALAWVVRPEMVPAR